MSSPETGLSIDARRHFLQALLRVLRPIIRLLIRHGIRYDEFADVARGAFVESAIRDGSKGASRPTRERVALITGIPRQRVDHYVDDEAALPTTDPTPTRLMSELLHKWHTDPQYLDRDRAPLELEFDAHSGPSFKRLVAQINTSADPYLALDELLKTRSVVYIDETHLRVITRVFLWPGDWPHGIEYFGTALAHLIQTHEYNFSPENADRKRLERFVSADQGLPSRLVPSFHTVARERANQLLLELDDWFAHFSDVTIDEEDPRATAGVDVFFYVEPPSDPRPLSTLIQVRRKTGAPGGERTS